jgi:hypothetical protein
MNVPLVGTFVQRMKSITESALITVVTVACLSNLK